MTPTVRCGRCGQSWTREAWQELPVKATLTAADLDGRVSVWPIDVVVQIRACTRCGGQVARARRTVGAKVPLHSPEA